MIQSKTFDAALSNWLTLHTLNRRPRTQEFNAEIVATVRKHWPDLTADTSSISLDDLLAFAQSVAHYCPSRWNAIVSALRFITSEANALNFRKLNQRNFVPPSQAQFKSLLAECDAAPRYQAGLVIRFLSFTGMRITEARLLRWEDVKNDHIEVPPEITKNGKGRLIPFLPGTADVVERLMCIEHTGYVLPRENSRKAIETACRRAGLKPMSFHCFRHLFATRCIEQGVSIPVVARWLGHQDGGALLSRTYFHLVEDHSRAMASRVQI